jgi:hypothetical protein
MEAAPRQHRLFEGGHALGGAAALREALQSLNRQRALSSAQEQFACAQVLFLQGHPEPDQHVVRNNSRSSEGKGFPTMGKVCSAQAPNVEELAMQLQPTSRNAHPAAEQQPAIVDTLWRTHRAVQLQQTVACVHGACGSGIGLWFVRLLLCLQTSWAAKCRMLRCIHDDCMVV